MEVRKLKKVIEAELLCSKDCINFGILKEKDDYAIKVAKAVKIYKDLCLSQLEPKDKMDIMISFIKNVPEEGKEMLVKFRDMIAFSTGKDQKRIVDLLVLLSKDSGVDQHERSIIAVSLYNHAFYDVCYDCFEKIAIDENVDINYRVEACRYLYGSELVHSRELSQECLIDIIENISIKCDLRYKIIAGFISKSGVVSYLNQSKVRVPYNENFIYGLQTAFFYNKMNGVRERILSGQHLLQMTASIIEDNEKDEIGEILLSIARDTTLDENTRADASDVLLRLGNKTQRDTARSIITSLGYSAVNTGNSNVMNRVKTIYNNSQNIHDEKIGESVARFIEKMLSEDNIKLRSYQEIQKDVSNVIRAKKKEQSKKYVAYKALDRISIDTATFTNKKVTLAEIFIHVWARVCTYTGEMRDLLEERLIEELIDMGDTCSSGHSGRFVNVLSIVDDDLKISFESQIIANVAGRVNARIRDILDIDRKASISMGMLPDSDNDDKKIYKEFITSTLSTLRKELYEEFVTPRYISEPEFNTSFEKAQKQWLDMLN